MPIWLWDASGLVKRYVSEPGTDTVNAIFGLSLIGSMICTFHGYSEIYAILRRRRNGGQLGPAGFQAARTALEDEVLDNANFQFLTVPDPVILAGLRLIDRHNLNSTDATILAAYLEYQQSQSSAEPRCILVASDHRLLRAAEAEGLITLDPENITATDLPAFLSTL